MFDILVYLFETYFHAEGCPEPEQLARKLSAAGFEEEEISEALEWLSGLDHISRTAPPLIAADSVSTRCFGEDELVKLGVECRGFLGFLETAGVLNALTREMIIERAMALNETTVSLSKFKLIVLMVLWNQHQAMDAFILEELLSEEAARFVH